MSVIDFHSHILPKGDHGSDSEQQAVRQLELLKSAGVGTVVATPHFYPNRHTVKDFEKEEIACLKALLKKAPDDRPSIALGAEVLIFDNIDRMEGIEDLCIKGTRVMLLEMPMDSDWSDQLFETIHRLMKKDITIVLAHIDRYLPKCRDDIRYILDMGAYAQINASSLDRFFLKRYLKPFLEDERIVAFGTDLHGENKAAVDSFASLRTLKKGVFERVMSRSEELLKNAEIY